MENMVLKKLNALPTHVFENATTGTGYEGGIILESPQYKKVNTSISP
jgi:hypothetical protein